MPLAAQECIFTTRAISNMRLADDRSQTLPDDSDSTVGFHQVLEEEWQVSGIEANLLQAASGAT